MSKPIFTGARAILKIAGQKLAVCTGVDVSESLSYETVRGLDLLEVFENVETSYDCSLTVDTIKVIGQNPTQTGLKPHQDLLSILTQPELTGEIYDAVSGQIVCVVQGLKIQSSNFSVRAGATVANKLVFVAKRVLDVAEL